MEIIGNKEKAVAIIDRENEKNLEKILEKNKNVKTVLKKVSERYGKYRLKNYEIVFGEKDTEVIHKEYGYILKLDPQKVYFSSREGTERQRIAEMVKENENVMIFFAGIGSYAVSIVKKNPKVKKVCCIEINPNAIEYLKENLKLNKIEDKVEYVLGDVKEEAKKFFGIFDRVIMPLPLNSLEFLECAINCLKREGIIHIYGISEEKMFFLDFEESLKKRLEKINIEFEIFGKQKVLEYAPRKYKIRIDLKIKKFHKNRN